MAVPIMLKPGDRFGRLVVIAQALDDPRPGTHWLCRCDCGGQRVAGGGELRNKPERVKSCGCARHEGRIRATETTTRHMEAGQRFGRYTIVARAERGNFPGAHWLCRCDCGTERVVYGHSLRAGRTASCGCYHKDRLRETLTTHGDSKRSAWAPEFQAWASMIQRCTNPNSAGYGDYGGRGIVVCDRWLDSYGTFLADMGRKPSADHSLDRMDNNGHYEPDNCRWATRSEQQRNKRRYAKSPRRVRALQRAGLL